MLLIDMEMPKGCNSCPIVRGCSKGDFYRIEPRPKGCPLKGLPKEKSRLSKKSMDDLYLEIKARWNRIRALPDANPDECAFLVHLMEEIEQNTDD